MGLGEERVEPVALMTTVTEEYARVSMHGVRRELLEAQARAAGLAVVEVRIPTPCANDVYEQRMAQTLASSVLAPAEAVAFGDLFLEDVRAYRVERLGQVGKTAVFPLWGRHGSKSGFAVQIGLGATVNGLRLQLGGDMKNRCTLDL